MPPKKNPKTREEILEQKRIAERLRYERLKNDPQKKEEMKEKERRKYQIKKEKGTRKLVKDMTRREHKAAKKTWTEHCTTYRAKKKALQEITNNFIRENTPDSECSALVCPAPLRSPVRQRSPAVVLSNVRKKQAKKIRERVIREKDFKIEQYKKTLEKYRKRLYRLQKAINTKNKIDSPNTKLQKMCDSTETRQDVVRKALFGEILNEQLKENYAKLKTVKEKQIFGKVVSGNLVDKHKLWKSKESAITYKRIQKAACQQTLIPPPHFRRNKVSDKCFKTVRNFYENDDNSRIGSGKHECVTRRGVKKQKRYLLDSINNLHKKFIAENYKISYQTFCRLCPFWVVTPKVNERDTCLCINACQCRFETVCLTESQNIALQ